MLMLLLKAIAVGCALMRSYLRGDGSGMLRRPAPTSLAATTQDVRYEIMRLTVYWLHNILNCAGGLAGRR